MKNVRMPSNAPVQNRREQGKARSLQNGKVARVFLAALQARGNGRERSLAAVTRDMWGYGATECRADSLTLVKTLKAACEGTGVKFTCRQNPQDKNDYLVAIRY